MSFRLSAIKLCFYAVLFVAACADDDADATTLPECGGLATRDVASLDIAEGICDPDGDDCTVCVQDEDDAGVAITWSVFDEVCECR